MRHASNEKRKLSDDSSDAIAAVAIIALVVTVVVMWLQSMP